MSFDKVTIKKAKMLIVVPSYNCNTTSIFFSIINNMVMKKVYGNVLTEHNVNCIIPVQNVPFPVNPELHLQEITPVSFKHDALL